MTIAREVSAYIYAKNSLTDYVRRSITKKGDIYVWKLPRGTLQKHLYKHCNGKRAKVLDTTWDVHRHGKLIVGVCVETYNEDGKVFKDKKVQHRYWPLSFFKKVKK